LSESAFCLCGADVAWEGVLREVLRGVLRRLFVRGSDSGEMRPLRRVCSGEITARGDIDMRKNGARDVDVFWAEIPGGFVWRVFGAMLLLF
jgi:hypothetical protein